MYKTDLVRKVAQETRYSQRIISEVLTASTRQIEQSLRKGEAVIIPGFGTFYTSELAAGTVKNISTGEPIEYEARSIARFRAGEILQRAVRGENRLGKSIGKKAN